MRSRHRREQAVKKQKTYELNLTKFELVHLRDMFGVILPPDMNKTLSQSLAEVESRVLIESLLWKKIEASCIDAEIPLGPEAPDYAVVPTGSPSLGVFQIASEPSTDQESEE